MIRLNGVLSIRHMIITKNSSSSLLTTLGQDFDIPGALSVIEDRLHDEECRARIERGLDQANDPHAVRVSHEDYMVNLRERITSKFFSHA